LSNVANPSSRELSAARLDVLLDLLTVAGGRLTPALHVPFVEDAVDVVLYGRQGNAQPTRDQLV